MTDPTGENGCRQPPFDGAAGNPGLRPTRAARGWPPVDPAVRLPTYRREAVTVMPFARPGSDRPATLATRRSADG